MIYYEVTRKKSFFDQPTHEIKAFLNEKQFEDWRSKQLNTNRGRLTLTRLSESEVEMLEWASEVFSKSP